MELIHLFGGVEENQRKEIILGMSKIRENFWFIM